MVNIPGTGDSVETLPTAIFYTQLPRQIQGCILMLLNAQNSYLESMRVVHKKSVERLDPFQVEQSMVQIALSMLSTENKPHIFSWLSLFASMPFGMCFFTPLYLTSIMRWFSIKVQ